MKAKRLVSIAAVFLVSTCSMFSANNETVEIVNENQTPVNMQPVIILQHQTKGTLVCCRTTDEVTAEECAQALEKACFVRIQDLPYRSAQYDFLTVDTYPTRRWRENEKTPRW